MTDSLKRPELVVIILRAETLLAGPEGTRLEQNAQARLKSAKHADQVVYGIKRNKHIYLKVRDERKENQGHSPNKSI